MLILGLDPGSLHTGYGLLLKRGSTLTTVDAGRFSCPKNQALPARLAHLVVCMGELLVRHRPDVAVVESPFHGMNIHSLIVLAQARGALLAAVAGHGVEVREYSPAEVKSAVTGNGRADKEQVARMVRLLLSLGDERVLAADATDALALAICCAQRLRMDRLAEGAGARR
ncbi:MAG TPA: crossover junction endodeoxyribonuclease RuvC [Thermoanaerobaculia bacterium]|jgi:crossover junction endodeoxyribonuclease RuvC|nr:crossover junction endodeoxyribonuclease RuvC [Thermoanaerobaculia bacterium]